MKFVFYQKFPLKDIFGFIYVVYFPIGNTIKRNFMGKTIGVFAPIMLLLFQESLASSDRLPMVLSIYFYKYSARRYVKVKTITASLEVIKGLLSFKLYRSRAQYTHYFIFIRTHLGLRKLPLIQKAIIIIINEKTAPKRKEAISIVIKTPAPKYNLLL